jgi:hypothetical protein
VALALTTVIQSRRRREDAGRKPAAAEMAHLASAGAVEIETTASTKMPGASWNSWRAAPVRRLHNCQAFACDATSCWR